MIEALSLLVSSITLVLERRNQRGARDPYDDRELYAGLVNLHDVGRWWLGATRRTNRNLQAWIDLGGPDEDVTEVLPAVDGNRRIGEATRNALSEPLRKVLDVHSPGLADSIQTLVGDRSQRLTTAASDLRILRDNEPEALISFHAELAEQTRLLAEALERLRLLIVDLRTGARNRG